MPIEIEVDDDTKRDLKVIIDHFDDEDRAVRDRQIRVWRRLKLLWENIQHTYYSEVAHDWRIPEFERSGGDTDQGYYDKPVNIYRAYLESIIAALSITVPPITCYPDDADNPLDITSAKAGNKIAELIFRHNNAPLFWLRALFVYCTEGMTACYIYTKASEEYGIYKTKKYEKIPENHQSTVCSVCQSEIADETILDTQENKFDPNSIDATFNSLINQNPGMELCPNCGNMMVPDKINQTVTVNRVVGETNNPKSRVCMEVYGGLFVKVPVWARTQKECSYLIYSYETHYSNVIEEYPEYHDKIERGGQSAHDMYEQWGRVSPQYRGEHPINNVTVRNCWLRPSAYNILQKDNSDELHKLYPNGMKVVVVNDQILDVVPESLDDHWTLTYNPLSDFLHFDPVGLLLTSVQDITNDLISLVLQTVEHGIPQTFADPKVLNFNAYANSEVIPGGIYPATPKSGRALSEGFYEVKTATLSQEVLPFAQKVQEIGQLVSGALPSLFGGQMSGSRTASEYSMSRAQALQRLQTTWKMLTMWWKDIFGKAIPMYIKEMKDDEKQVKKDEFGNFINVFIRMAELQGKIGNIELEANENLPITWNQQKDSIMELLQMNNDMLTTTLMTPENMGYLKRAIGLTDYIIPGEDDRQKEYEEIQLLINSEPIEMPPDPNLIMLSMQQGMPPPPPQRVPSIEPDFDADNHMMASDIDRRWLVSDAGRLCKLENPSGYENVLLHMKMHKDMNTQQQMQQAMTMPPPMPPGQTDKGDTPPPKPPDGNAGVEMNGDQNVPTIQ